MTLNDGFCSHWVRCGQWLIFLVGICHGAMGLAQTEAEGNNILDDLESVFSTALILTDTESATLGFVSFDPRFLVRVDSDDYGTEASVDRRNNVRSFTFPWRWQLSEGHNRQSHIKIRLSYLEVRQDVVFGEVDDRSEGRHKDLIYGGYLEKGWSYSLTNEWQVGAAVGAHLLHYQNRYSYDSALDQVIDADIGGVLLDSDARALVAQIQPRLLYVREDAARPWALHSTLSYYLGRTVNSDAIRPETWSWSNGLRVRWDLPDLWATPNQLRFSARRIEVGGDVTDSLGTHNYYQFGVGWLFETKNRWSWLDNVGVRVALNIGSALSGGSLVLLYNENEKLF